MTGDPSFCTLWTLLGFPAITIPTGLSARSALRNQLAGPAREDIRLLRVARWCEAAVAFERPSRERSRAAALAAARFRLRYAAPGAAP